MAIAPSCSLRGEPVAPHAFAAGGLRAVELRPEDEAHLQHFFEQNPEYFVAVGAQPPQPGEAREEMHGALPPGWPYTKKWVFGLLDERDEIAGVANIVSDLLAPHVWHVGLFIVATRLHGRGVAGPVYDPLERWMADQGALWVRLGVVRGNARGERFWARAGFAEVRTRENFEMGVRRVTIRVMAKSLTGGDMQTYLALVSRDRPEP